MDSRYDHLERYFCFMNSAMFGRIILTLITGGCLYCASAGAVTPPAAAPLPKKSDPLWEFSLLPRAFQKHPLLAISIITEMTDEGRKLKPPTPENPTYYYVFSAGFHEEGSVAVESGRVSNQDLEPRVQHALAASGYLPGSPEHPPALLLVFFWGVHNKLDQGDIETGEGGFPDINHQNVLSRAALVGGTAFAKELAKALREQDMLGGRMPSVFDPVYRFANRDDLTRNLVEQVLDDCYYVVISAYDGASVARGEKKLLWRTKMSTPAQGVSLVETTPALIDSGADFFGREMKAASIVGKRISRERGGRVDLGPMEFKGYMDKPGDKETPPEKK